MAEERAPEHDAISPLSNGSVIENTSQNKKGQRKLPFYHSVWKLFAASIRLSVSGWELSHCDIPSV